jgi:cytochrome P450
MDRAVRRLPPLSTAPQVAAAHRATEALLAALPGARAAGPADAANLLGLLSQTCEATAGLLGNCIVGLLRGAAPAGLVTTTMELDPAIHNTRRFAAREVAIGPVTVGAGQGILLVLAAAGAEHGFGHDAHRCPGQAIARTIVEQALDALLTAEALPRVTWRYRPSVNARIPVFMEVAA